MSMPPAPLDALAQAVDAAGLLVAGVTREQWATPTPCTDWTVRELVNHLVTGNRAFTALLRDEAPPDLEADHLDGDPVGAYRTAAADLLAAFREPDVLERAYPSPVGPAPGLVLLHLRVVETLVHGWDLARATGQPDDMPAAVAGHELALTVEHLPDVPRGTGRFGPAQPVAYDAPALDRLAAYLGRPPGPAATSGQLPLRDGPQPE